MVAFGGQGRRYRRDGGPLSGAVDTLKDDGALRHVAQGLQAE